MELTLFGRSAGKNGVVIAQALIDHADAEAAAMYRWYLGGRHRRYVMAFEHGKTVLLHRLVLGAQSGQRVRHLNGDPLDNRRANLALV